jgi:hypothetical protein
MRAGQNADPSYRQSVSAVLLAGPARSAAALTGRRHPLSPGGIPHRGGFVDREIHVNRRNFIRSGAIAASLALPALARANTSTPAPAAATPAAASSATPEFAPTPDDRLAPLRGRHPHRAARRRRCNPRLGAAARHE